jgi:hypothetical protein
MMSAELRRGGHGQADGHRATVRGSPLRPRGHHPVRVRWYLRFKLSLRGLVEMMAERGLSGRETANRHDAGLKGLCDRGDYDRRYRIDASHPQGTVRTGTSGCPRPTWACSLECRAPCLKSLDRYGTLSGAGYLHQSRHECGPELSREFIGRHAQLLSRTEEGPLVAPLSRFRLRQLSSVLRAFVARREGRRRVDLTRSPHRFAMTAICAFGRRPASTPGRVSRPRPIKESGRMT